MTSAEVAPAGPDTPEFGEGGDTYGGAGGAGGAAGSHGALGGHSDVTRGEGDTPEATKAGEPPNLGFRSAQEWGGGLGRGVRGTWREFRGSGGIHGSLEQIEGDFGGF